MDTGEHLARIKGDDHETGVEVGELAKLTGLTVRTLSKAPLTILDYTKILGAIRMNHEKYFAERKQSGVHTSIGLVIILKSIRMIRPKGGKRYIWDCEASRHA